MRSQPSVFSSVMWIHPLRRLFSVTYKAGGLWTNLGYKASQKLGVFPWKYLTVDNCMACQPPCEGPTVG